jgi:hypothetical protein
MLAAHSALLREFTQLAFDESAEARWQESRPTEADIDVGPATRTDLQSDLIEALRNPFQLVGEQIRRLMGRYLCANTAPEKRRYLRRSQLRSEDFTAKLICNVHFWIERVPELIGLYDNIAIAHRNSGIVRVSLRGALLSRPILPA